MSQPVPTRYCAAFWGMVFLAPLPGLAVYLSWLADLDQYGYVFPLLLALVALVAFRWDHRLCMPRDWASIGMLGSGMLLALFAAYRASPWLSSVAFSLVTMSWLHSHRSSSEGHQRLTYLGLLLLMMIRLPLNLDLQLASGLQRITSRVSSNLLDSFGVTHFLRGNVIELPGGTLFVEEACSGVQSLFTVLFLVCLWIVFVRRPLIATPAYLLFGLLWAMVMNVVRITAIALAQEWYDVNLSEGAAHEALGWICLAMAVLMVLSTDRLLRVAFYPIPPDESGYVGNPITQLFNRSLLLGVGETEDDQGESASGEIESVGVLSPRFANALFAFVLLICIPSIAFGYRVVSTRFESRVASDGKPLLWEPGPELMRETRYQALITDYQTLRDANSKQLGNHADVWTILLDGMPVRIAVSQPYPEWHDMRLCYRGNGWQVNDWVPELDDSALAEQNGDGASDEVGSRGRPRSQPRREPWPVSYAEFVRDSGEYGTLLFCGLTQERDLLFPPMSGLYSLFDDRLKDRASLKTNIIMLQLWTETAKPLVPEELEKLQRLFDAFRWNVATGINRGTPRSGDLANLAGSGAEEEGQ